VQVLENPCGTRLLADLKTVTITGPHALPCRRANAFHSSCATLWLQKVSALLAGIPHLAEVRGVRDDIN
jgi:hypothetical protein